MKQASELLHLLGYRLQLAHMLATTDARAELEPYGLTPAKLTALLLIRDNPGCDQTTLGKALNVNRSSAMKIVNTLAEQDLIERRPGRDLRSNALHLTTIGKTRVAEMMRAIRVSDERVAQPLSGDERATLIALLDRVIASQASTPGEA